MRGDMVVEGSVPAERVGKEQEWGCWGSDPSQLQPAKGAPKQGTGVDRLGWAHLLCPIGHGQHPS